MMEIENLLLYHAKNREGVTWCEWCREYMGIAKGVMAMIFIHIASS